ncbi:hypothetical protein GOBAR_AA09666 [Gossypium barbadense]|uniref:Uncharacterized protein n=1 Tax=Gossypium barbadense TaxID=3634 RepID=A0A2P5Y5V1_GOSBA|nr:hypothetical protein GOBAR_AA09666 [Gossypium barbadense]
MNPNRLVYSCRSFDWAPPEYFSPPPLFKSSSNGEEERPIFFDSKAKSKCSASAETVPGRHPERWHKDAADNIVCDDRVLYSERLETDIAVVFDTVVKYSFDRRRQR